MPVLAGLSGLLRESGPAPEPPAPWRIWLSGALAAFGLALSTYLTVIHFTLKYVPGCVQGSVINCQQVLNSPQSHVFGIPVAVLGLAYYAVVAPLCSPWAWRARDRRIHLARLVLLVVGIAFVLYLVSAELLEIKAICEFCTGVHLVTFAQLILVMATVPTMLGWGRVADEPVPAPRAPTGRNRGASRDSTNGRQQPRPVAARSRRR